MLLSRRKGIALGSCRKGSMGSSLGNLDKIKRCLSNAKLKVLVLGTHAERFT